MRGSRTAGGLGEKTGGDFFIVDANTDDGDAGGVDRSYWNFNLAAEGLRSIASGRGLARIDRVRHMLHHALK